MSAANSSLRRRTITLDGDVLTVSTGGGGGYGAPDGRSAERIDDDATQRRISARPGSNFERPEVEIAK